MYEINLDHPLSIQILKIKMSSTKCPVSDTTHATPFYHSKHQVSWLGLIYVIRIWTKNHLILHGFECHLHKTISSLQMLNTIMSNQGTHFSGGPSISFYIRSDLSYKNLVVVLGAQQLMIMTISKVVDGSKYFRQNKFSSPSKWMIGLEMATLLHSLKITYPLENMPGPNRGESSLPTIHSTWGHYLMARYIRRFCSKMLSASWLKNCWCLYHMGVEPKIGGKQKTQNGWWK